MIDYTIKRFNRYSKEELVAALKEYSKQKNIEYVAAQDFCDWLGISETTAARPFGSWSSLCKAAGLNPRYDRTNDMSTLLENLGIVWAKLGRQPRAKEMKQSLSPISCSRYLKEFGSWYQACLEFLSWKSGMSIDDIAREARGSAAASVSISSDRKKNRRISLSLRYEVLRRDGFRCIKCGRSPATEVGVELHVDHIHPWSKGGEAVIENLQTLCSDCNLGKSDKT